MSSFIASITKRKKTPEKLVKLCLQLLTDPTAAAAAATADSETIEGEKEDNGICKRLSQMKAILYGDGDKIEIDEEKTVELSTSMQSSGLMIVLINELNNIPFEARKDTAQIFNNLVHKNIAEFATYVKENFQMVLKLMDGYLVPDIALSCGSMLRECARHDELAIAMLHSDHLWMFFDTYVHLPNFDVSSDAFNTLRDLLTTTRNKSIASEFLNTQYEKVFSKYEILLQSDNYVTRRRSLKLLAELLLDRSNFSIMIRFIADRKNLQLIMNLLRDKSPNIQFEAFHVFKVFVANPKKPVDIVTILYNNKDKLISYLNNFHLDREDAQFVDEKRLLVDTLTALQRPVDSKHKAPASAPAAAEAHSKEESLVATDTAAAPAPHPKEKSQGEDDSTTLTSDAVVEKQIENISIS